VLFASDGRFYIYATGVDGVHAYVSDHLFEGYRDIGIVFSKKGCKEFWAPSVIELEGKYYMYVSFMPDGEDDVHLQAMHVAVSDKPEGPFACIKKLIEPFSIDSHVVKNESGLFMFYSLNDYEAERAGTYIVVDRMLDPFTVEGKPETVVRPTLDEEIFMKDRFRKGQHWHTLEGAFYFREGDYHYVLYSGNCYETEYYYIGYAVAKTNESDLTKITFKKYPDEATYRPLISANEFESGTGHNSLIKVNGEYYVIYHGRDNVDNWREMGECRTARICRLNVNGEQLTVERFSDKV
jgi:GH43 family beta-xylosidase